MRVRAVAVSRRVVLLSRKSRVAYMIVPSEAVTARYVIIVWVALGLDSTLYTHWMIQGYSMNGYIEKVKRIDYYRTDGHALETAIHAWR